MLWNKLIGSSGRSLKTVTFTSSQSFIVPSGVTNLETVVGKGSNGVSDSATNLETIFYVAGPGDTTGTPTAPYYTWDQLYAAMLNYSNSCASAGFVSKTLVTGRLVTLFAAPKFVQDSYSVSSSTFNSHYPTLPSQVYVYGQCTVGNLTGNTPLTTGNILVSQIPLKQAGWRVTNLIQAPGRAGAAASGFGKSFSGGSYSGTYPNAIGTAAATTSFSNVAVTPGQSYSVIVPSGGQIKITYFE